MILAHFVSSMKLVMIVEMMIIVCPVFQKKKKLILFTDNRTTV